MGGMVFRSGLVQSLSSEFLSDYWVVQVKFFFKKNQNDVVLVKKKNKSQRVATGFLTRYCRVAGLIYQVSRVTPDFFLLLFFF